MFTEPTTIETELNQTDLNEDFFGQFEIEQAINEGRETINQKISESESIHDDQDTPPDQGPDASEIRDGDFDGLSKEQAEQKYTKAKQADGVENMQLRKVNGEWHAFLGTKDILDLANAEKWDQKATDEMRGVIQELGATGRAVLSHQQDGERSQGIFTISNGEIIINYWKENPEQQENTQTRSPSELQPEIDPRLFIQDQDLPEGIKNQDLVYQKGTTSAKLVAAAEGKFDLKLSDGSLLSESIKNPAEREAFHLALTNRQETELGQRASFYTKDAEGNLIITILAFDQNNGVLQKTLVEKDRGIKDEQLGDLDALQNNIAEIQTDAHLNQSAPEKLESHPVAESDQTETVEKIAQKTVEITEIEDLDIAFDLKMAEVRVDQKEFNSNQLEFKPAAITIESISATPQTETRNSNLVELVQAAQIRSAEIKQQILTGNKIIEQDSLQAHSRLIQTNQSVFESSGIGLALDKIEAIQDSLESPEQNAVPEQSFKQQQFAENNFTITTQSSNEQTQTVEISQTKNINNEGQLANYGESNFQDFETAEPALQINSIESNQKAAETDGQQTIKISFSERNQSQTIENSKDDFLDQTAPDQQQEIKISSIQPEKNATPEINVSDFEKKPAQSQTLSQNENRAERLGEALRTVFTKRLQNARQEHRTLSNFLNRNETRRPTPTGAASDQQKDLRQTPKSPAGSKPSPARQLKIAA